MSIVSVLVALNKEKGKTKLQQVEESMQSSECIGKSAEDFSCSLPSFGATKTFTIISYIKEAGRRGSVVRTKTLIHEAVGSSPWVQRLCSPRVGCWIALMKPRA